MKVLHSIHQQIWETQQWPQDWKRSVFIPIPKKDNAKERSNYCTIVLISHASKVMLKILQASLQQYVRQERPDVAVVVQSLSCVQHFVIPWTASGQASLSFTISWSLLKLKPIDIQAGFRKGRRTRDQIANIRWIIEKAREFQKSIYFCCIGYAIKPLTVWITTNCGKFLKRWEYQTTYLSHEKPVCRTRSNS